MTNFEVETLFASIIDKKCPIVNRSELVGRAVLKGQVFILEKVTFMYEKSVLNSDQRPL